METPPKSFHARGLGPIVRVQGRMTAEDYRAILRTHLLPYWRRNNPGNWVFQQDNDPTFWGCFHFLPLLYLRLVYSCLFYSFNG